MSLISVTGPARPVLDDLTARVDGLETGSVAGWKGPYTNTSAGLSATSNGDVFYTADSNGIVLYRNDSGTATELTSMMGSDAVQADLNAEANARAAADTARIRWFSTRAAAVSAATIETWAIGAQIAAGNSIWQYDGVSNLIPDMPGWIPVIMISLSAFGALDESDLTITFQRAAASGKIVHVPPGDYTVSDVISPVSGGGFVAPYGATIRVNGSSAALLDLTNKQNVTFMGFTVYGNTSVTGVTIQMYDSKYCEISGNIFHDMPVAQWGCIRLQGASSGNRIFGNRSFDNGDSFIALDGADVSENDVVENFVYNGGKFGIILSGGAHNNLIAGNKTTLNGIELVGVTVDCHHNRIAYNHAEGTGDNGISITGSYNTVVGNVCYKCAHSGINVYGSFNTIIGNNCSSNNQASLTSAAFYAGITVQGAFGGAASHNIVTGNTSDDDQDAPTQYNCISVLDNFYPTWASGTIFEAGTNYIKYGNNIYRGSAAGTTGETPPTHTSGTVSDGGISWTWVARFYDDVYHSARNIVRDNNLGRYTSAPVYTDAAMYNEIDFRGSISRGDASLSAITYRDRLASGGSWTYWINVNSTDVASINYNSSAHIMSYNILDGTPISFNRFGVTFGGQKINKRVYVTAASYDVLTTDNIIGVSPPSGGCVVNLPTSNRSAGREIIIKDESGLSASRNITVDGGDWTIDGAETIVVSTAFGSVRLYSSGGKWLTI